MVTDGIATRHRRVSATWDGNRLSRGTEVYILILINFPLNVSNHMALLGSRALLQEIPQRQKQLATGSLTQLKLKKRKEKNKEEPQNHTKLVQRSEAEELRTV